MKKILLIFVKYYLFWLFYFLIAKFIFLLYNFNLTCSLEFSEISGVFFHGFKMDLSLVSYLMVFPGIVLAFSYFIRPIVLGNIFKIYTFLLLFSITFINIIDLGLYPHWGTRVGISAFDYVGNPEGVSSSITFKDVLSAILLVAFYIGFFTFFYFRWLKSDILECARQKWYFSPITIFITAFLIIPIRGGLGTAPINLSTVSFSNKLYVNHASYNFMWNFLKTIERSKKMVNPCNYTNRNEALSKFNSAEKQRVIIDSLIVEIDTSRLPNVIFIVLESFSNKVISSFGGKNDICPNLDSISKDGIIFTSFYASGNRSDRGMAALLGGYPSLLTQSVINYPDKSVKLKKMSSYFNQNGYWSSFYYGGDIDFYNLKSFVLQGEYREIISQDDFPKEIRNMSSWGVPDGFLFERVLNEIDKKQPFFTTVYTLSSHTPYDVPVQMIKAETNEEKYLNSIAYTDSCLGDFIKAFKKTKYWDNTLVIITADHGHLFPGPTEIIEPETYRIPLIWTGGVVKNAATIENICGQPDLIPTLVKQFKWKPDSALFGHDILSTPSYAFYIWDTGWGYISEEGEFIYDQNSGDFKTHKKYNENKPDYDFAKAYLQVLHEDFLTK